MDEELFLPSADVRLLWTAGKSGAVSMNPTYTLLKCRGYNYNIYNNTQIAAVALPPLTTHPQLWAELLTFKPKSQ